MTFRDSLPALIGGATMLGFVIFGVLQVTPVGSERAQYQQARQTQLPTVAQGIVDNYVPLLVKLPQADQQEQWAYLDITYLKKRHNPNEVADG